MHVRIMNREMVDSWVGGNDGKARKTIHQLRHMSVHVLPHFFPLMPFCRDRVSLGNCFFFLGFQAVEVLLYWPVSRCCKVQGQSPITNQGGSGGGGWGLWGSF